MTHIITNLQQMLDIAQNVAVLVGIVAGLGAALGIGRKNRLQEIETAANNAALYVEQKRKTLQAAGIPISLAEAKQIGLDKLADLVPSATGSEVEVFLEAAIKRLPAFKAAGPVRGTDGKFTKN
jgi:hypothetical protein